jgi:hypothetical protein
MKEVGLARSIEGVLAYTSFDVYEAAAVGIYPTRRQEKNEN